MEGAYIDDDDDDVIIIGHDEQQSKRLDEEYQAQTKHFIDSTAPYRLDKWYEQLKTFTFYTEHFAMNAVEAYALFQVYYGEVMSENCRLALAYLEKRVDDCIKTKFPNGCFLKLSTRSPKDYCWDFRDQDYFQHTVQKLSEYMKEIGLHQVQLPRQLTLKQANSIYKFLMENSRQRARVRSGKDFVNIFSKSERIVIDLENLSTAHGYLFRSFKLNDYSRGSEELIKICFRQWGDFLWQNQFRCFYYNYKLTGVCPYEQDCLFEQWIGREEYLKKRLQQYFDRLEPQLRLANIPNGVIDVYFTNDEKEIAVIEVNPFDRNTRASLFNWQSDHELLTEGKAVEVRVNTNSSVKIISKLKSIMGMLEKKSIDVVKLALQNIGSRIILE